MLLRGIVALLICTGAVTACGDADPAERAPSDPVVSSSAPKPAQGSGELVLRWTLSGGLAGRGGPGSVPDFSLYADGRTIVPGQGATPDLREYRLTEAATQRLLAEARSAGLGRPRTIERPGIADAFTLEITFGSARTRVVHPEGQSDPVVRFWKRLSPDTWPAQDQAGPVRPYRFERLALLAAETGSGQQAKPWPLGPLGRGEQAAGGLCTVVSGGDLATASRLVRGAPPGSMWSSSGKAYSVRLRPLLPDESTCAELGRR